MIPATRQQQQQQQHWQHWHQQQQQQQQQQRRHPHSHSHSHSHPRRRRSATWLPANNSGIYYRPESLAGQQRSLSENLPAPHIGPRRNRPHAIHIVTFPAGYTPRELRPDVTSKANKPRKARGTRSMTSNLDPTAIRPSTAHPLSSLFTDYSPNAGPSASTDTRVSSSHSHSHSHSNAASTSSSRRNNHGGGGDGGSSSGSVRTKAGNHHHKRGDSTASQLLDKFISSFSGRSFSAMESSRPGSRLGSRPGSRPGTSPATTGTAAAVAVAVAAALAVVPQPPAYDDVPEDSAARARVEPHNSSSPQHHPAAEADMAATAVAGSALVPPSSGNMLGRRNSLVSVRSAKSNATIPVVVEVSKPVASGSGVSCSILLAERNIFLHGFDHDGRAARDGHGGTALLRGKLQLNVTKNVKLKAIQLKLVGRARTEWPEGIPPLRQEVCQEESLRTQVLTFFNVMHDGWESEYGDQCTYQLKAGSANSSSTNLNTLPRQNQRPVSLLPPSSSSSNSGLTAKQLKRLSLQSTQSRSFGKSENGAASTAQAKGYKVFYPGTYDYNFELPIDHHQLETIKLQYGSVKWELHASVDRAGAFRPNLHGVKELSVVRLPDQMSLEMSEPISISRRWEDQLHYDIVISGKSFPIGSRIPIAFKLTPLAKVQVHKLKVYVTESIEYWTTDKRVTRKDPVRKILLLEKTAGKPLDPNWAACEVNTLQGGELSPEQRRQAREMANFRRTREAAQQGRSAEPLPEPTNNLLGDLDLGLEHMWGATEIEANVQLPTCQTMAKHKDLRLHPDCSWKNVNVYHWIKIVLRISRLDPADPTGTKRRHFEISIDSPFTVLNCRATQANTVLPAYAGPTSPAAPCQSACGCPDSATVASEGSPSSSNGTLPGMDASNNDAAGSARSPVPLATEEGEPRPIHLLRVPSFQPPAFDEDTAPPLMSPRPTSPPLISPPPQYDAVVGRPGMDGLADYFVRLADYGYRNGDGNDSESDSDEHPARILGRSGRVNVCNPRTPGNRRMASRSFEISRPMTQIDGASLPRPAVQRAEGAQ
ncbi:hypothetical protein E4U42_005563 [Claviceps africana]|uniref:Arrestin C-terminal-like domain-containing protein n=1 Tax=Claviceps africana TaxID=83212 RepID=A0A8K0JE85_9HYPO|nr:hypothetical protein E4U42_005563 [Claviceps africana]